MPETLLHLPCFSVSIPHKQKFRLNGSRDPAIRERLGQTQPRQCLGIKRKKTETEATVLFSVSAKKVLSEEAEVTMERRKEYTLYCVCVWGGRAGRVGLADQPRANICQPVSSTVW